VLPFSVSFKPGLSVHEQVVFAVKKTCVAGQLRPGDPFPSVRALSQHLRINPNTAHKVVATLVAEGLLEVRPGIGTAVARAPAATRGQRRALLNEETERLVVEARKLSLDLREVLDAVEDQWKRLDGQG
jgi:DNA-binding transcriptional regulator YhcF (GntR family)